MITNNSSTPDQNQQLLDRFHNIGAHYIIVPGTTSLTIATSLYSTDPIHSVMQYLDWAVVIKRTFKVIVNEVMSIDDSDIYNCSADL